MNSPQTGFEQLLKETPLLEATSTLNGVDQSLVEDIDNPDSPPEGSVYFGTGLCTAKAMTVGVPFDVLGMLFVAEKLRRYFGLKKIIQLVADTHAKSNSFTNPEEVDRAASRMIETIHTVVSSLGQEEIFHPLLSSSFDTSPEYQNVFQGIQTDDHEYVRREWSDIEYLRQQQDLKLKLSWIVDPKAKKVGFDERLYDLRFREVTGQEMSFAYVMAGRTLDADRPKVSPYICIPKENRILLQKDEKVVEKLESAKARLSETRFKSIEDHLESIVNMYNDLFDGTIVNKNIADSVSELIVKLL